MGQRWVIPAVFGASAALAVVLVSVEPARPPPPVAATPPIVSPPPAARVDDPDLAAPDAGVAAVVVPAPEVNGPCPQGTTLVDGWHCPFVAHKCAKIRRAHGPSVCERHRPVVLCEGTMERLRFCIDRAEYPNQPGVLPAVLSDFDEATRACDAEGKRLCSVREWQLACEGDAILPYPTGTDREKDACNWDRGAETPVTPSRGPTVAVEMERTDRRQPSGTHERCTSPFGVLDLGGNVAEWTTEPGGGRARAPFVSAIVGGAWGDGPATCRTADASLPPNHRSSTLGFRCCVDPADEPRIAGERRRSKGGFRSIVAGHRP